MINRELIRIKVVQLVYAYYLNEKRSMDAVEKELDTSITKAYHLYMYLLSLIVAVTKEERVRFEVQTMRAKREGKELPSERFVKNRFALQLAQNEQLALFNEDKSYDWEIHIEFVRNVCNLIEGSQLYKEYMDSEDDSYESDRAFWRNIYKQLIEHNNDLDELLEEKSLYWNDDKDVVDSFVIKTIKRFQPENAEKQELLPEKNDSEDEDFAHKLILATIRNGEEYQKYIEQFSEHWKLSRMPFTDIVIMQTALAEMLAFPEIPLSVTFNEYIELSKVYSTPKSSAYINGMLDHIAKGLKKQGVLLKN